jgi:hypothetical protein
MTIFMTILMVVLNCKASILDDRALMLLNARDPNVLKIKIKAMSESNKLKARCDFELSETLIPESCYRLRLPKEKTQVIDKACERASYIMKEEMEIKSLSPKCAEYVGKKNKDLKYSKEESTPENYILGSK